MADRRPAETFGGYPRSDSCKGARLKSSHRAAEAISIPRRGTHDALAVRAYAQSFICPVRRGVTRELQVEGMLHGPVPGSP